MHDTRCPGPCPCKRWRIKRAATLPEYSLQKLPKVQRSEGAAKTAQTASLADITDIKDEPVEIKRSGQRAFTNNSPFSRSLEINNTASVSVHLPSDLHECG